MQECNSKGLPDFIINKRITFYSEDNSRVKMESLYLWITNSSPAFYVAVKRLLKNLTSDKTVFSPYFIGLFPLSFLFGHPKMA